jgi:hypothetical protein
MLERNGTDDNFYPRNGHTIAISSLDKRYRYLLLATVNHLKVRIRVNEYRDEVIGIIFMLQQPEKCSRYNLLCLCNDNGVTDTTYFAPVTVTK